MVSSTFSAWIFVHLVMGRPTEKSSSTSPKKPHIIVIMADDLGWNDVSYHGSNQIPTPNIDALAYNGVILHNYYTQPVCTPSRASFLTGQYAIRTGLQGSPLSIGERRSLPLNFTLFPEYFRKLGYATSLIGKWHVGYHASEFLPTSRGFDTFYGYYNGYIKYFTYIIENGNHTPGYDLHHDVHQCFSVDWKPQKVYATDLFTTKAESVIDNHDPDVPLYLHFSHLAPHVSDRKYGFEVRDPRKVNESFAHIFNLRRRLYAGMVSALDESVGRVVQALDKKGMLDDSIVIFMSDNGALASGPLSNAGSNYPYRGQKFGLYEGGVHVPAFIWSPIVKNASRVHEGYFHVTDWLPTLYKLAGGNISELGSIDGINQQDSIVNGSPSPRDSILLNINELRLSSGAIKGRFKYLTGFSIRRGRFLGENADDGDLFAPPYNVTSVMKSMAALAIANTRNETFVSKNKILKLRRNSKVVCAPYSRRQIDCQKICLFDILADPCETSDLSARYPQVVDELTGFVENYRKVLVPQRKVETDSQSLPDYEGGPWLPWLDLDGQPLPRPRFKLQPTVSNDSLNCLSI